MGPVNRSWVQVCKSNPFARRADLLATLRTAPDLVVVVEPVDCLDRCTLCEKWPFALVDGQMVSADTCEELAAFILEQEKGAGAPNAGSKS